MSVYLFFHSKRKEKQLTVTGSRKKRKQAVEVEVSLISSLRERFQEHPELFQTQLMLAIITSSALSAQGFMGGTRQATFPQ